MSNSWGELKLKFTNIESNIEKIGNNFNTLYQEQIKLLEERYDFNKLQAKYETNLNNERERLLKENSRQKIIQIDLVNDLKENIQTKSFFDDILTFIEKIKQNSNLISMQRKSHMCFQKLLNKEFKFQSVFNASKLKKYKHILGIQGYFNLIDLDKQFWKAIKNHNLAVVGLFIEAGADVDTKNECHQTALIYASEKGLLELVKFLLKRNANVNANSASIKKSKYMKTSDYIEASVFDQLAQYMMNNDKDFLFNKAFFCLYDYYGKTPLLSASKQGHFEIVEYLVSNSAELNSRDENGNNAFLLASKYGHYLIVEYLIEKGCDVNTRNFSENSALFFATAQGNCERVEYFVKKGADVNAKNKDNKTALMFASESGHLEIVKYLIEKGTDVNARDKDNKTALMFAAICGYFDIVKFLVENKTNVDLDDKVINAALIYASKNGHNNIVNYLAEYKGHVSIHDNDKKGINTESASSKRIKIHEYFYNNRD